MKIVAIAAAMLLAAVTGADAEGIGRQKAPKSSSAIALPWDQPVPVAQDVKLHNFEAGVFGGWAFGAEKVLECEEDYRCKFDLEGFAWGGYANYMLRPSAQIAAGVEIDAMRLEAEQGFADWLLSLRSRGGFYVTPTTMVYGTGGVAWEPENNETGWVAGAGIELNPTKNTAVRAEWLHYEFEDAVGLEPRFEVLKASIGFKF